MVLPRRNIQAVLDRLQTDMRSHNYPIYTRAPFSLTLLKVSERINSKIAVHKWYYSAFNNNTINVKWLDLNRFIFHLTRVLSYERVDRYAESTDVTHTKLCLHCIRGKGLVIYIIYNIIRGYYYITFSYQAGFTHVSHTCAVLKENYN